MAIPLIPLLAGAAIGGLATYLYSDEKARKQLKKTAFGVTDKAKQTSDTVGRKVSAGVSTLKQKVSRSSPAKTKVVAEETATSDKPQTVKKKVRKVASKKVAAKKTTSTKSKPAESE